MIALQLFLQILSLFMIIGLGFTLVKTGVLKPSDSRVLSVICIYIVMPCAAINAFSIDYSPEVAKGLLTAACLSALWHIFLIVVMTFFGKKLNLSRTEQASVIYTNAGNLVLPLVVALFGKEWVIYASGYMCMQIPFMFSHGQTLMSGQAEINWKKILTNVNMISVFVGVILFFGRLRFPAVISGVISSLAAMLGPTAMLVIGIMIGGTDLKALFSQKRVYKVVFLRLIAASAVAVLFVRTAGLFISLENEKTILMISLLAMITPTASTITQFAQFYDNEPEYSSTINVVGTLLCILTMPVMIALYSL